MTLATIIGAAINFSPVDPIKALYWSAVINGALDVPIMIVMMLMTTNVQVMEKFTLPAPLRVVGWVATLVMVAAAIGMILTTFTAA